MRTSIAQRDSTALSLMFGLPPDQDVADRVVISADVPFDPVCNRDMRRYVAVTSRRHSSSDRETIVNRLLDWAEDARARGRERRAEYLVCLAWEAYDRVPG